MSKDTLGVYPWEATAEAIDWGLGDSMDVDVPGLRRAWLEVDVANDEEDVVLRGESERVGGEEGVPGEGEDGRDGCFRAERSIVAGKEYQKIFISAPPLIRA